MHRKNTWIFYFFIILFTALISMNLIWRFTPIKTEIKAGLEEKLRPYLGENFTIQDFSLGFGFISLYDLKAAGKNKNFQLQLQEVQIGFSIHKLLLHRFNVLKVIESVTFKNPHLVVYAKKSSQSPDTSQRSLDFTRVLQGFQQLSEIDRILINDGLIIWKKDEGKNITLLQHADGYLIVQAQNQVLLDVEGNIFNSPQSALHLAGTIDLARERWQASALIRESDLPDGFPFLNGDNFYFTGLRVKGLLKMKCPSFDLNDIELEGTIKAAYLKAVLFNQEIQTGPFDLTFEGQKMNISPVVGIAGDGHFNLVGNLGEIFKPGLYFSLDFDNYSARNLVKSVPILELLNKGKLQGHVEINGRISDLKITGTVYSSKLYYAFVPFYRSQLKFVYDNRSKIWTFNELKVHAIGLDHRGTGYINFVRNKIRLNLTSTATLGPEALQILDRLNNCQMVYRTTFEGDFPTLTFGGEVQGVIYHNQDTLLTARTRYTLVDDVIKLESTEAYPNDWSFHAEVSNLWDEPVFDILEVKDVPFDSLSTLAVVHWLSKRFRSDFYFSGPVNYPSGKVNFVDRHSGNTFFSFQGAAVKLFQTGLKFKGNFIFQTSPRRIRGQVELVDKNDHIVVSLKSPHMVNGQVVIASGEEAPFSGKFRFENIPLRQYVGANTRFYEALQEGTVSGEMIISGTNQAPEINFKMNANDFIINQNGYYTANVSGKLENNHLRIYDSWIKLNNQPILKADVRWNILTDSLLAHFSGNNIESNFLAATLFKNNQLIKGNFAYRVTLEGNFDRPQIRGDLNFEEGMLLDRPFDKIVAVLEDSIPAPARLFDFGKHIIKIHKFSFLNKRRYNIKGYGLLPVDTRGALDLYLEADGNVLAELPNLLDFFQNPDCVGQLRIHLTGSRERPELSAGSLEIYNGSLQFSSVIPPLNELRAKIYKNEDDRDVHIEYLEGKIDNRYAKISNIFTPPPTAPDLQPWDFENIGLNLGILVLETEEKGIPLSIPGLMMPNDIGYFATAGKVEGEKFYFAGPVKRPHARGQVILYDCRVTYPFLISEEASTEEEDKVLDFLMNMEWDVKAKVGLGTRYFVDIPAVIGKVYLDLNIDNVSPGLLFTGRLADESFRVTGEVESTRGQVEYLDINFKVDKFGAIFNPFELYPEVYGRAYTTVRDSTNFPKDIYLELYAIDPETKEEVQRGRWEDFRFKLVSSSPTIGETQDQVLAYLGYSLNNLRNKAGSVGLTLTENYLFRPLFRPLERKLERGFHLDYVRLKSNFASNLFYFGLQNQVQLTPNPNIYGPSYTTAFHPALLLFQSTELTLGKYLWQNIYLTYSGQLVAVYDESKIGFNHRFGIEYRLLRNLLLEFEYDKFLINPEFYNQGALSDFRIRLRHSFNF